MHYTIVVAPDGSTRHIYDETGEKLFQCLGPVETVRRASHVDVTEDLRESARQYLQGKFEPVPQGWWADMSPVDGPVLGPFATRHTALHAEKEWLEANNIPVRNTP